jgi:AGCS family alanine or glycine:cation symporter
MTFGFAFSALQAYTVATSFQDAFGIPTWISGIGLVIVLGLIIFGGIKRIASTAEIVVPVMAIGYILLALVVILLNLGEVPGVFMLIVRSAFGLEEAFAGGMGAALAMGVRRGLFSNEAGLGSAPNVAAVAYVRHPANQGIVQAFSVFIDTLVICSCTAFMILLSGIWSPELQEASGVALTQSALADHVGEWGRSFVSIALMLFAFSSMIYNYYLGENSLNFFSEENKTLFNAFRVLTLALVLWGSLQGPVDRVRLRRRHDGPAGGGQPRRGAAADQGRPADHPRLRRAAPRRHRPAGVRPGQVRRPRHRPRGLAGRSRRRRRRLNRRRQRRQSRHC